MRAVWSGTMGFGMLNMPIKLYTAIEKEQIPLHRICKCGGEVGYVNRCKRCNAELTSGDWDMGYKVAKDEYIRISKDKIEAIKIASQENINLFAFVPKDEISELSITGDHYFVGIAEKKNINMAARTAYLLLKEVLRRKGLVAVGKLCMRGKENLVIVESFSKGLILTKIYYAEQIREGEEVFFDGDGLKIDEETLELGYKLVSKAKFRYEEHKDRYAEALRKLIENGEVTNEEVTSVRSEIYDLKELLKASIEA